ncbi:MAG: hypothetical protein JZU50_08330 [Desulfobulbaceae bacterium]|nr:hypothetical protein [Desulfobulbaceae bacterium]
MILIETSGGRIRLHNGKVETTGPRAAELVEVAQEAVERAGCAPADGEPDHNAALILIGEYGGRVLEHRPTTIPGRVY